MMKRILFVAIATMVLSMTTYAANKEGKKPCNLSPEKMMEMRAQGMARKLMLGDEAKGKFIPLYQQYQQELAELRQECKPEKGGEGSEKDLTDSELDAQFKTYIENSRKLTSIKEKYYSKFREFLTARQVNQIFRIKQTREEKVHKPLQGRPDQRFRNQNSHPEFARVKR